MARRTIRETFKRYRGTLANGEIAVRGKVAYGKVGDGLLYADPSTSTALLPLGYFMDDVTGDGTLTVVVDLFREVHADWLVNDGVNAVAGGDVFSECYAKTGDTVTMLSTSHSKAGRVWGVDATKGVLVEAGPAVTGPSGPTGNQVAGVATRTALAAVAAVDRFDGMLMLVRSDGSLWRFVAASVLTSDEALELAVAPAAGTGCWLRADKAFTLKLPIDHTLADAATLLTCPAGMALRMTGLPYWDITTGWTGGTNSAIGISSDDVDTAKGDLLGGAAGELTAAIGTAGIVPGTLGGKNDTLAHIQAFMLRAGKKFRFDKIASTYAAGAGYACIPVSVEITG